MKNKELVISDYYELLALHKALLEAKFHRDPDNSMVAGSPFIASISKRTVELLIEIDMSKDLSKKESWERVLNIKNQGDRWEVALEYAEESNDWDKFTDERRIKYVEYLLSPHIYTEEDVVEFISEVTKRRLKR